MTDYGAVADDATIGKTAAALEQNGFRVTVVENSTEGKKVILDLLPKGAEVLTVTSQTLAGMGLIEAINESGDYDAIRPKLNAMMGDQTKRREMRKLGAAPDHVIGSVHALTQDGHALIASATGSQLPSYSFGAGHVIWVVGAQKIVTDLEDAWERLKVHVFPLENERAMKAYGAPSSINKVVTYNKEVVPDRVDIVLIKEALGF